jgi:hypothetical protein
VRSETIVADAIWFLDAATRRAFERLGCVPLAFFTSTFECVAGHFIYVLTFVIAIPTIGARLVRVAFSDRDDELPSVQVMEAVVKPADPRWSPHRYRDGSLCMWFPDDPPARRWVPGDGLDALVAYIRAHLVREDWWRRAGEWPGPEAPHATVAKAGAR